MQGEVESEYCSKCGDCPEDILMLNCCHDLCLNCACRQFHEQNPSKDSLVNRGITCHICYQKTVLDKNSIRELQNLWNDLKPLSLRRHRQLIKSQEPTVASTKVETAKLGLGAGSINDDMTRQRPSLASEQGKSVRKQMLQSRRNEKEATEFVTLYEEIDKYKSVGREVKFDNFAKKPLSTSPIGTLNVPTRLQNNNYIPKQEAQLLAPTRNNPVSKVATTNHCTQHPQDQIQYFCLTCECQCICPECIIHGPHKTHEVRTLKRAVSHVKQKIQQTSKFLEGVLKEIETQKLEHETQLRSIVEMVSWNKKQLKMGFDDLKTKINQQEALCMKKCDLFLETHKGILESNISSLKKHLELIKGEISTMNNALKAAELKMLNTYAKNKQKYLELRDIDSLKFPIEQATLSPEVQLEIMKEIIGRLRDIDYADIADKPGVMQQQRTRPTRVSQGISFSEDRPKT